MKKINSVGYGGNVIGVGTVLFAVIPLILKVAAYLTGKLVFSLLGKISFCCGAVILVGFAILLAVELHQDKKLNNYYQNKRNERRALPNNLFECAACGSRQVAEHDTSCPVCGIRFKLEEEQNGQ